MYEHQTTHIVRSKPMHVGGPKGGEELKVWSLVARSRGGAGVGTEAGEWRIIEDPCLGAPTERLRIIHKHM